MKRKLSDLKQEGSQLSPLISVGKNGITETLVEELIYQLKQHKLVKVKIQKTALNNEDKKTLAEELSIRTGSQLIEMRGSNAVLYRK
ncbi:MAG TPA: YhbY family RNA-binding protein [archaeon]|nr:YhbY family RNA-binding protein [archaeon]